MKGAEVGDVLHAVRVAIEQCLFVVICGSHQHSVFASSLGVCEGNGAGQCARVLVCGCSIGHEVRAKFIHSKFFLLLNSPASRQLSGKATSHHRPATECDGAASLQLLHLVVWWLLLHAQQSKACAKLTCRCGFPIPERVGNTIQRPVA